jgi:hypothetical protein
MTLVRIWKDVPVTAVVEYLPLIKDGFAIDIADVLKDGARITVKRRRRRSANVVWTTAMLAQAHALRVKGMTWRGVARRLKVRSVGGVAQAVRKYEKRKGVAK